MAAANPSAGTQLFWELCSSGSLPQITSMATDDININWSNPRGQGLVPLSLACHRRHPLLVQHLLGLPGIQVNLVEIPPYQNQAFRDPDLLAIFDLLLAQPDLDLAQIGEGSARLFDWALHHHDTRLLARLLNRPDFRLHPKALFDAGGLGGVTCPLILQQLLEHPATPATAEHPTLRKTVVEFTCYFGNTRFLLFLLASGREDVASMAEALLHAIETQECRSIYLCRECLQILHQWRLDRRAALLSARAATGWQSGAAGLYYLATLMREDQIRGKHTANRGLRILALVNDNLRMALAHKGAGDAWRTFSLSRDLLAAEAKLKDQVSPHSS